MDYPNAEQGAGVMNSKRAAEKRAETVLARLATDPDAIRGGPALTMMIEIISANRDKRSPEPGAVVYWATMFDAWITSDNTKKTLDDLLELTGTQGKSPIRVEYQRNLRDARYMDYMGYLVGAGFTVEEAAPLVIKHATFGKLNPEVLYKARALTERFEELGGVEWAKKCGFFGDDPKMKAARDAIVKSIQNKDLPARFR